MLEVNGATERLSSRDGFFHIAPALHASPLHAILDMAASGFTSPAVVFLDFSQQKENTELHHSKDEGPDIRRARDEVRLAMAAAYGAMKAVHLRTLDVGRLGDEADKEKIYGAASKIRGGLYEFIDDTNNPNVATRLAPGDCAVCGPELRCCADPRRGDVRVAAVFAEVTQHGQFMLRELLEAGSHSRTHRFCVRKRHLVFVLCALPGHPLTAQSASRANLVLPFGGATL